MEEIELFIWIAALGLLAIFSAWIGGVIGAYRGRAGEGRIFGLLLGPFGWLLTSLLPEGGKKCPECLGVVPELARRCKHCGSELASSHAEFDNAIFILHNDKREGPFTMIQLRVLLGSGKLTPQTLCAQDGAQDWKPLITILK